MKLGWLAALSLVAAQAPAQPQLIYGVVEGEAATEFQPGEGQLGPGYLRLIATGEFQLTDSLTAKAVVSPCAGVHGEQPRGVTQCSPDRRVEELTVGGFGEGYDFSAGLQIVTLGNSEGFVVLDRFNGRDLCRFARLDTQNKLPNWLGQGRVFLDDFTLTATLAPFSPESRLPKAGSYCEDRFNDPGRFEGIDDPGNNELEDWAGGLEVAVSRDSWSGTLNIISTREDLFVLATAPTLTKTRPRTLWLGGSASATAGSFVVRGEVAFAPDRTFTLDPRVTVERIMAGRASDGTDGRWNLLAVVGLELRRDDWFWALQYYDERVEAGPDLTRDEDWRMASVRVRRSFANDRLQLSSFTVLDLNDRDIALQGALTYEVEQGTTLEVGGTTYTDFNDKVGLFGRYEGRESLYLKLRRTF